MTATKSPAKSSDRTAPAIQTAMVLAAGRGTRMRHLSTDRPKPLVHVGGEALLDRVLDRIVEAGIARAVVNIHTKADMIAAQLSDRQRPNIVISDERAELLETGGGVKHALPLIADDAFLIHNSDCLWLEGMGENLRRLTAAWDPKTMDALLLVTSVIDTIGYDGLGDFLMDGHGRLTRRGEKLPAPFVFTGASVAHRRLFDDTPDGPFSLNLVWDRAAEAGRLFGVRMEGVWMHVGTPEAVAEAEARFASAADSQSDTERNWS